MRQERLGRKVHLTDRNTGGSRRQETNKQQEGAMQNFIVQGEARDDSGDMQNGQEKAGDRQEWTGDRMKLPRR
jgi:hypothetical protein